MAKIKTLLNRMLSSYKTVIASCLFLSVITACSSTYDMQGHDPREYYSKNPIENKIEIQNAMLMVVFNKYSVSLLHNDSNSFSSFLNKINPRAVEGVTLWVSPRMALKYSRIKSIKNLLTKYGYNVKVKISNNRKLGANKMAVDISYVAVVAPDCPDWKRSPVTTYSNTLPANYGCAATVNLGLMVDNPRDLVHGQDSRVNDTKRSSKALTDYNSGDDVPTASTSVDN